MSTIIITVDRSSLTKTLLREALGLKPRSHYLKAHATRMEDEQWKTGYLDLEHEFRREGRTTELALEALY